MTNEGLRNRGNGSREGEAPHLADVGIPLPTQNRPANSAAHLGIQSLAAAAGASALAGGGGGGGGGLGKSGPTC